MNLLTIDDDLEAFNKFFEEEFDDSEKTPTIKNVAWCAFVAGMTHAQSIIENQ